MLQCCVILMRDEAKMYDTILKYLFYTLFILHIGSFWLTRFFTTRDHDIRALRRPGDHLKTRYNYSGNLVLLLRYD